MGHQGERLSAPTVLNRTKTVRLLGFMAVTLQKLFKKRQSKNHYSGYLQLGSAAPVSLEACHRNKLAEPCFAPAQTTEPAVGQPKIPGLEL